MLLFGLDKLINLQQSKQKMNHRINKQIQLPSDFAEQLLNYDIQISLSADPSTEIITKIIQLYSEGMSYYESIRSYKYLYFQKKMNQIFQLMAKKSAKVPSENQCFEISKKVTKLSTIEQSQEEKIQTIKIRQQQQRIKTQVNQKINTVNASLEAKNILEKCDVRQIQFSSKLRNQLENQDKNLQQKLMRRKSKGLFARSLSLCDPQTRSSSITDCTNDQKQTLQCLGVNKQSIIKPLQVSFDSIIREDEEQDEHQNALHLNIDRSPSYKNFKAKSSHNLLNNS